MMSGMLADLDRDQLMSLSLTDLKAIEWRSKWMARARKKQIAPDGNWRRWGIQAGRGFGKTETAAQWLAWSAYRDPEALPRAVIAPTLSDVQYTCIEGVSGLLAVIPPELVLKYDKSDLIITLVNGATIRGFSAEKPERLRGPQHCEVWCDEVAAWQYADETWDMMIFGLRLGALTRVVWTSTPKPRDIIRRLAKPEDRCLLTFGSTHENKDNLSPEFYEELMQFEGTRIGRQEIYGELIDPEESGIIKRSWLRLWPHDKPLPRLQMIIMSLDTAFTEATIDKKSHDPDSSACTVWGTFEHKDKHDSAPRSHVMLLDAWDEQLGLPDLVRRVRKELNVRYGDDQDVALVQPMFGSSKPNTSGRKVDMVLIEDKGSGISLRQVLEREGILAHAYNPGRADKLTRLHVVSPIFERRLVWLPESAKLPGKPRTWAEPMLGQLCAFVGSGSIKHDDYVDSVSQAMRVMMDKSMITAIKVRKANDDDVVVDRKPVVNPYAA